MLDTLWAVQLSCSIASIVGALFIIFLYFVMKSYQNFALKMVLFIAVSDMILAFSFLINMNTDVPFSLRKYKKTTCCVSCKPSSRPLEN
jgi:hypothetical protein